MTRAWIGFVPLAFYLGMVAYGCAAAAESAHTGQQLDCVDQAKTVEESGACRAKVRTRWAKDGGDQ